MAKVSMNVSIQRVPKNNNLFEFTISTPMLRSQFRLPRAEVNRLRVALEKALMGEVKK